MKNIDKLIEKYFAGESTLAEEAQLREFFNQPNIPEHLRSYQPLFQFFKVEKEIQAPLTWKTKTTDNQIVQLKSVRFYVSRIAAVLVLTVGIWMTYTSLHTTENQDQAINWEQYEETDPEKALEETKAALLLLSQKLNTKKAMKGE